MDGLVPRTIMSADGRPECGVVSERGDENGRTLNAAGVSLGGLSAALANRFCRQVTDKTGLTGDYDFHVEYPSSEAIHCNPSLDPASDNAPLPPLVTALEQQLGLKLEPVTGQRGIIVIDRVERPREN